LESLFASGCDEGAVFFRDVAQHILFAQEPGLHAFSLEAFERMHVRAERGVAAIGSAIARRTDRTILFITAVIS
jgi:hypothetical protein